MARFTCGHELPKGRVGANLAHIPRDSSNRCPGCQTGSPTGVIRLLQALQKPSTPSPDPHKQHIDAVLTQSLITFILDRFIAQRREPGFKARFDQVFTAFGETCYRLLERKQIAGLSVTARGRWGGDVVKQMWRAVATAVLRTQGVYDPIEPAEAEILATLNNMVGFMRERAAGVETFEQLEIVYDSAATLRVLRDDVVAGLSALERGFVRWDASGK